MEEFLKLRREIRQYNKDIGHIPDGTLETEMLLDDEEYICLTKKNIEDLKSLVDQVGLGMAITIISVLHDGGTANGLSFNPGEGKGNFN